MKKKLLKFGESKPYAFLVFCYIIYTAVIVFFSINYFGFLWTFTNISGSMDPSLPVGSVSIVKKFPSYSVGDIISYYSEIDGKEQVVTHRVTALGGNVFVTKGDANEVADRELVPQRTIIGKVILVINGLGDFIGFSKSKFGTLFFIILPALAIISLEVFKIKHAK